MAFNPAASFGQGVQLAGQIQQQQQQNQVNALRGQVGQQIQKGGFNPSTSLDFQELSLLDPSAARVATQTFTELSEDRKTAYFQDMREGRKLLEQGDNQGFLDLFSGRLNDIEKLNGDTQGTKMILDKFVSGDIQGIITGLKRAEDAGIDSGFLKGEGLGSIDVQSAKILDDGTVIQSGRGGRVQVISPSGEVLTGDAAKDAVAISRDQAHNRKIELKKLDQTIKSAQAKEGILTKQQTEIQSGNIRRLGMLSTSSNGRSAARKKAIKFKMALENGEAFSGAGRKAASFIPGVFTSQGQFDEEFNAFAEVAARQQLKASGETRPTDADVQGMKQAMFGVGRDEKVNIQLLSDFINDQNAQDSELDQLIESTRDGNLSNFIFTPTGGDVDIGQLSDEDLFK